ncbi:MAG: hypothetical protein COB04_02025 [Gammaproteobacteria bacterium]|nr:MAG: hypothetical protein COB04_02025 [Gammaproteobacteria bacterium]
MKEWPVGSVLRIIGDIEERSMIGLTVTVLGPLEDISGERVQRVDVHGIEPPPPSDCFLARPKDLGEFPDEDKLMDEGFEFDPSKWIWHPEKEKTE